MLFQKIAIVGVGLIGGSIALAAKSHQVCHQVIGLGRRIDSLRHAQSLGVIDHFAEDWESVYPEVDLIVFCTPVDQIPSQVSHAQKRCKPGTLLTDVGSTKAQIVRSLNDANANGVAFLGSHPLAGSEKKGAENAKANLFHQRVTVLTPSETTTDVTKNRIEHFWTALGSKVVCMTPEEHDQALAMTSHLPHLLASTLAGILPSKWQSLTATGFRDTTRIAAGDPEIWTAIFRENHEALLLALQQFQQHLDRFTTAIQTNPDQLFQLLSEAKKVRDALGN